MIYIIEDDENIRNLVQVALNGSGYETAAFETAEEALGAFKVKAPRLAIFDLMLPGMDGLEAIRKIRANDAWKKLPVLVLTAKDKEYDKVAGLDGGADDYMTKPFSVLELLARVRSLLRRTKEEEPEQPKLFDCGALHLDLETREVKVNGREILLTYKEYELLVYLAENQNRVVSRDELLDKLWDWRADVETRTLDIHIKTLRQKLGEEAGHYIKTVRSVGYRFMKKEKWGNEKNYDKKSGTGPLWHDLSIGAGDQQHCFVFFSWEPDAAGKYRDDGKDDFCSGIHTGYGQTVAEAATEGSCICTGCECPGYDNRKRRNSAC